jgi:hypothetical protein
MDWTVCGACNRSRYCTPCARNALANATKSPGLCVVTDRGEIQCFTCLAKARVDQFLAGAPLTPTERVRRFVAVCVATDIPASSSPSSSSSSSAPARSWQK